MSGAAKKLRILILMMFLTLAASGIVSIAGTQDVQAATAGFKTINGKNYYIKSDGQKAKGWMTLNGKRYFFDKSTGVQRTGWLYTSTAKYYFNPSKIPANCYASTGWRKSSDGTRRYFNPTNYKMTTGWATIDGNKYYFNPVTGIMKTGWLYQKNDKYYMSPTTGVMTTKAFTKDKKLNIYRYFGSDGKMLRGWGAFGNYRRYFRDGSDSSTYDGAMVVGFRKIDGYTYYFMNSSSKRGVRGHGWLTVSSTGNRYYMDPYNSDRMVVSTTKTIGGVKYKFDANGVATMVSSTTSPTGSKTIKNYLAGALQPVGQALYVWGGGWTDSTRKGVSPTWVAWYNSQNSSYNYNNYRDLSAATRAKGLDCSGFVGWAAYQVMQTKSGVGSGYTVVSGEIGSYYRSLGWGSIVTQSALASSNYKLYPGDVGYNDGHTWIVLGQCADKSVVIVHSTPNAGCQIAGTPTPSGGYESQAIALARKYMSRYPGFTKYSYHTSSGNYIRNGNFLRWNRSTLADPDGYLNKTADQILADLFK
ncbi:MAG: N-acetylmuramoyl-L-alanine amidase family protein [Eubacteriales bacterium]|nr:N-acetylmuramoyl-L-alanine amidase family protein [Eubacteriales bacterium]